MHLTTQRDYLGAFSETDLKQTLPAFQARRVTLFEKGLTPSEIAVEERVPTSKIKKDLAISLEKMYREVSRANS
jgi:hypothetical protein